MNPKSYLPLCAPATANTSRRDSHTLSLLIYSIVTLAGLFYVLGTVQTRWATALVSFIAGIAAAAAWRAGRGLLPGRSPVWTPGDGPIAASSCADRDVWQDIDANRDLLHLLHERTRLPADGVCAHQRSPSPPHARPSFPDPASLPSAANDQAGE